TSLSVESGPMCAPQPTVVPPCNCTPGSIVTSLASVTSTSTQVLAGSRTVTPAYCQSRSTRRFSSLASSVSCTLSLTPAVSQGSAATSVPTGLPSALAIPRTSVK